MHIIGDSWALKAAKRAILAMAIATATLSAPLATAGGTASTLTNSASLLATDPLVRELVDTAKTAETDALGAREDTNGVRLAVGDALIEHIRQRIAAGDSISDVSVALNKILVTRCSSKANRNAICPISPDVRESIAAVNAQLATLYANAPSAVRTRPTLLGLPTPPGPPAPGSGYR